MELKEKINFMNSKYFEVDNDEKHMMLNESYYEE